MTNNNDAFLHAKTFVEVIDEMNSSESGLTSKEASERLHKYGLNRIIKKKKESRLTVLWRQINNPLIWVLIGSGTLAVILGKPTEGLVVLAVVIINTFIGFIQEFKAGKAIEALSEMVPENATVYRNGQKTSIPVSEIVPGDIAELEAGVRVPADMRLIWQKNLTVEEAALTGESLPAQKSVLPAEPDATLGDRTCMVYSGTLVVTGTARAVVTSTGMDTELGKISDMLSETTDLETPLTRKLAVIGKYLTIGIIVLTVVIMIIGTIRATSNGVPLNMALKDSLIFAIALAVGAIPEGLPAVVTIALAVGVQRMAGRKAIIRTLPAVETLGSTTVICTDKTGTLTKNEMTVSRLWTPEYNLKVTGAGYNPEGTFLKNDTEIQNLPEEAVKLLENAVLCSSADFRFENNEYTTTGDSTEIALIVVAHKAKIDIEKIRDANSVIDVIPFGSETKYMATLISNESQQIIIKGAPEVILKRCIIGKPEYDNISAEVESLAAKGMRVLAVAHKNREPKNSGLFKDDETESGFQFSGLLGMTDVPRTEAIDAIRACHDAGIVVKMITGDHRETARAIGTELGLSEKGEVLTGNELAAMNDETFSEMADNTNIFARVAPEHKLRLVRALQADNQIVAMTGDGINDAPSLKQANIGIAMGITGTSVSKESSDIVLADDNFASISAAVEEGRRVYDNLLKSLAFLLPTNLGLAFILVYGIAFFPFNLSAGELLLPMLPTQLLWINLIAAVALALPLAFEVKEPNVMKRPPRIPNAPLFNSFVTFRLIIVSLLMTAGTIILFICFYSLYQKNGLDPSLALTKAQTIAVTFVILFQIFYMLNCRSLHNSIWQIGLFSNPSVYAGIGIVLGLHMVFIYAPFMHSIFKSVPLSFNEILITTIAGFLIFPFIGIEKLVHSIYQRRKRKKYGAHADKLS